MTARHPSEATRSFHSGCPGPSSGLLAALAIVVLGAWASAAASQTPDPPRILEGLGDHHHPISTQDPVVQAFFDQGVRLVYAFNHEEAIRSFRHAAELDPACAMCWWGVAWALGPNINASMDDPSARRALEAIDRARDLSGSASDEDRAYIEVMAQRYGPVDATARAARDSAYARAAEALALGRPDDPDAQVIAAEARMLLSPWDYWTEEGRARHGMGPAVERLRVTTERWPSHAGACHFYIHAVEAAHPRRAVPCAERIADLMPGAGHVVHMPAHVFIRVGRYADAVTANRHALHADEGYIDTAQPDGVYRLALHPHNNHFLSFAAGMAGQSRLALESARELEAKVDRAMMRADGLGALQHYLVTPLRVMVRFGMWNAVLTEPAPPRDLAYPMGTWHYARGMALARTGQPDRAREELEALRGRVADPELSAVTVWDLNGAADILAVAERVLTGEIAAATGRTGEAVAALEEAVRLESALTYDEPPPWHLPVRHVLGAVLLEAGRAQEAEEAYRHSLERFPENGWALTGLVASLEAQDRADEAAAVRARLVDAWEGADVRPPGSRY